MTRPKQIVWCDGSERETEQIVEMLVAEGSTVRLNEKTYPNCILHRSDPNDVARTENVTFICTRRKEDAGPTNNWMAPAEAKEKIGALFDGAMAGRTMYVVPYLMGPADSPYDPRGRGSDRQPLRGCQHAHHGAHGQDGAGPHRQQQRLCARPAFAGRSQSRRGDSSCTSPKKS